MELWVKSQDKQCLVKATNLCIIFENDCTRTIFNFNGNEEKGTYLANYTSQQRADEILNEIHQRLIDLQTLEIMPDSYKAIKRNINCVYEMPEE